MLRHAAAGLCLLASASAQSVFLSELHYDNSGADTGEMNLGHRDLRDEVGSSFDDHGSSFMTPRLSSSVYVDGGVLVLHRTIPVLVTFLASR